MAELAYAFVMLIASMLISYAMTPKQQGPKAAAFEDFQFPMADEGTPQCVIFGDCWSPDWTVLAVGNFRTTPIKSDGGKK